jgi:hypothetical protein
MYHKILVTLSQVKIPAADIGCREAVAFGFCVATFIEEYRRRVSPDQKILSHFHDWTTSVGLLVCANPFIHSFMLI